MAKYGITRTRLYKVITETSRPGSSQYQQGLKRETKGKKGDTAPKEVAIKHEMKVQQETETPSAKGRGKGRGKSSQK